MEFDIGDIIRKLTGGMAPNAAVMNAQGAAPPAQQQAGPPPQTAPQGANTPVTNPIPPAAQPKALQSPSDLANMYVTLMEKNQNAARLDSGLNLIAAGLSNSPTNRAALISASGHGGGAGGMSLSASDMINFQKQADSQREAMLMQNALPALMKQYNMTPAQIQYLKSSGKLDEVLNNFATRSLAHITDANGQTHLVDDRAESRGGKGGGRIIATLGNEKEDPTQIAKGPLGDQVINMRTGQPVGSPVGLPPDKAIQANPNGTYTVVDKNATPGGAVVGQAAKPGDVIDPLENQLKAINDAKPEGEAKMTMPELIKLKQNPATNINVGADGSVLPKPDTGYDYNRGADGKPIIDPVTHRPTLYKIEGGGPADEAAKAAKAEAKTLSEEQKKDIKNKIHANLTSSAVGQAVDTALSLVDKPGATGFGSRWARSLSPGGTPADNIDAQLGSLKANVALETLKGLREASKTGASGLGAVTDFEQKMLASVFGPLETYQSGTNIKPTLARIKAAMELLAADDYDNKTDPAAATSKFMSDLHRRTDEILAKDVSGRGPIQVRVTPR